MEAMPPEAMAGMPPGYEAIDPMTGNALYRLTTVAVGVMVPTPVVV